MVPDRFPGGFDAVVDRRSCVRPGQGEAERLLFSAASISSRTTRRTKFSIRLSISPRVAWPGNRYGAPMAFGDWIQVGAVLAAVGASIIALVVSARDRKSAQKIAEGDRASAAAIAAQDRREALRQAHLIFELEALTRLLENLNRGGSSNKDESSKMGAEALTLVGVIGAERLPHLWEETAADDAALQTHFDDPEWPQYKKDAIEVQLAVNALRREIRAVLNANGNADR